MCQHRRKEYNDIIKHEINQYEREYYVINKNKIYDKSNQIKCLIECFKNRTKSEGYHAVCKNCDCNINKEYYEINSDVINGIKKIEYIIILFLDSLK